VWHRTWKNFYAKAIGWGELSECNILGDTSSAILYDIPLEMLKTMNNDMDMAWELMQARGREMRKENM